MSYRIPQDFAKVTFQQARKLVRTNVPDSFATNEKFFDGDHWQEGAGWPQEIDDTADGAAYLRSLIENLFESKNIVREVVTRFLDGVLENTPEASFAPEGEDEDAPDEVLERAQMIGGRIDRWMERRKFEEDARKAARFALMGGRAYIRPFVPRGRLGENNELSGSWEDVLNMIYTEPIRPTSAVVFQHPDTQRKLSVYHWTPGDAQEITDPNRDDDLERVELSWVDPNTGETILRILKEGEVPAELTEDEVTNPEERTILESQVQEQDRQLRVDLQENLFLQEIELEKLITEQVRSSQKSFNLTKTMQTHNEVSSGFSERVFFNAQPPGKFVEKEDGRREFQPNELRRGPFRSHYIRGVETLDEMGQTQLETPSMEIDEADDPEVFLKGKESKRKDILDECSQSFVIMNESAEVSGRSRLIARHEFTKTLNKAVEPIAELYRGTIMTALVVATTFGSEAPTFQDLRVPVEVYPDSGPLTPQEMSALEGMTESGLMSMQTALSRAGINDIEAEMERIEQEESSRLQRLQERAELVKQLVEAGASLPGAAQVAGWDEEDAQQLQTGFDGDLAQAVQQTANGNPR